MHGVGRCGPGNCDVLGGEDAVPGLCVGVGVEVGVAFYEGGEDCVARDAGVWVGERVD